MWRVVQYQEDFPQLYHVKAVRENLIVVDAANYPPQFYARHAIVWNCYQEVMPDGAMWLILAKGDVGDGGVFQLWTKAF